MSLLDAEQLVKFGKDYQAGMPVAELSERYGIAKSSISALRQRLGIPSRRPRKTRRIAAPEALEAARAELGG